MAEERRRQVPPPLSPVEILHLFSADDFSDVQALFAEAEIALPSVDIVSNQAEVLAYDGRFLVGAGKPPEDEAWLLLSEPDAGRGVAVPLADRRQLAALIGEAEAVLARTGFITSGPAARH